MEAAWEMLSFSYVNLQYYLKTGGLQPQKKKKNNVLVKISTELKLTADFPLPLPELISFQFAEVCS